MIIYTKEKNLNQKAEQLTEKFQFIFSESTPEKDEWFLQLSSLGLELHAPVNLKFSPFSISFIKENSRAKQFSKNESLAKAMTSGRNEKLTIIDATAGLGRDAFLLASLGHEVTMIERNPVLAAMLQIALEDAAIPNLHLMHADSENYIAQLEEKPDVIYLDPMFPERDKSALVKKDMQILQMLIGHDEGYNHLLERALLKAKQRVVVKRPRHGEFLNEQKPSFQILSKTLRFDIYLS